MGGGVVSAHYVKQATGCWWGEGRTNHSNHGIVGTLKINIEEVTNNSAIAKICLQPPKSTFMAFLYSWMNMHVMAKQKHVTCFLLRSDKVRRFP